MNYLVSQAVVSCAMLTLGPAPQNNILSIIVFFGVPAHSTIPLG